MKKIIEDLGCIYNSNDLSNQQLLSTQDLSNIEYYTVYLQFDDDPAVTLMHIPIGNEFLFRIKEPTVNSILNQECLEFSDKNTNKTLKIFTRK